MQRRVSLHGLSVDDGEEIYGLLQDIPPEFGFMNGMYGESRETFRTWLVHHEAMSRGEQVEPGFVPSSDYWLFVDDRPVGYGKMRHHLNEKLLEHGGHIGFAVRRSERGKGYGPLLLRELLAAAAARGIDRALLTCDEGNVRSIRTIEGCRGVLEDARNGRRRYWIDTAPYRREGDPVKVGSAFPFVFLDADGTILDFARSESVALQQLFIEQGLPFSDEVRTRYHEINSTLWRGFERGEVDKRDVQRLRFERLLGSVGRTGDPDAVNARYLQLLTENVFLVDGAVEACSALAARATLLLATNGVQWTQTRRMANSPLAPYFRFIVTSEEAGAQKPAPGFFAYSLAQCGNPDPAEVLMVGDQLSTDIRGGADAGLTTCWFNPAREARPVDAPRIDHEIHHLRELAPLLDRA